MVHKKNIVLVLSIVHVLITIVLIFSCKLQYTFLNSMIFLGLATILRNNKKQYIYIVLSMSINLILIFITEYLKTRGIELMWPWLYH